MEASPQQVTQLLRAWRNGDDSALDKLMPLVYEELRRAAKRQMARQAPGHTLQTLAVINEVYLRLVDPKSKDTEWQDRAHFLAYCARMMRNILVDHFRRHRPQVSLSEAGQSPQEQRVDVLSLNEALNELAKLDPRASRVVELRFFGGLTLEEVAEVLQVSPATAKRDWKDAKGWLYQELGREGKQ